MRIAEAIREGAYREGDQLVQEELAKRYSVSRNPVREALRLLEARGLVTIRDGVGATVRVLTPDELSEIYTLRIAIEPTIAQAVIDGATGRALQRLRVLAAAMEETVEGPEWLRTNFDFHSLLYELSERPRTTALLSSLLTAAQPYALHNIQSASGREQGDGDHRRIIDAIADGDAERLAELLVEHMVSAERRVVGVLQGD
ncbi:GntR family transcriptional regulator [Brachybacterium ginsengisoli]|nr:GntR family transcriptional regulator [Brachybacterium ginsengisoli]